MKNKRINLDYLNLYQEIPLFCALALRSFFRTKPRQGVSSGVLIVNTCLVGEFAASLPAIRDYIEHHADREVDLMVSPPLKSLAERVRGVRSVYVAKSLYGRSIEVGGTHGQHFPTYDTVFVMRISMDVYRLLQTISARTVRTGLREYSGYALHLWGSLLRRQTGRSYQCRT